MVPEYLWKEAEGSNRASEKCKNKRTSKEPVGTPWKVQRMTEQQLVLRCGGEFCTTQFTADECKGSEVKPEEAGAVQVL